MAPTASKKRALSQDDCESLNGHSSASKAPEAMVEAGIRPSGMKCVGILPGMGNYSNSSDESSDSSDSDDGDFSTAILPTAGKTVVVSESPKVSRQPSRTGVVEHSCS